MVKTAVLASLLPVATAGVISIGDVISLNSKAIVDFEFAVDKRNCSLMDFEPAKTAGKAFDDEISGECPGFLLGMDTPDEADAENDQQHMLEDAQAQARSVIAQFQDLISQATQVANAELVLAQQLWVKFRVTDPDAAAQMQLAKKSAAELFQAAQRAGKARAELEQHLGYGKPGQSSAADVILQQLELAKGVLEEVTLLYRLSNPEVQYGSASDAFQPAMAFVNAAHQDLPMTCSGDVIGNAVAAESSEGCAAACELHGDECVGFAYYPSSSPKRSLCFLLSDFESGRYYTGCVMAHDGVMGPHPTCMARAAKLAARSLHPQEDGACQACFKDIQSSSRCWQ